MEDKNEQKQWPPVWAYRLIAGIHFLRGIGLLTAVSLTIIMNASNATGLDPILIIFLSPLFIIDLVFGFLILMRKNKVILPVAIYVSLFGIPFLIMAFVVPVFQMIYLLFYSLIIEMFLIAYLGILWIKREWVHD